MQELVRSYDTMSKKERKKATKLIKDQHEYEIADAQARWQRNQLKRSKRKANHIISNNNNNIS